MCWCLPCSIFLKRKLDGTSTYHVCSGLLESTGNVFPEDASNGFQWLLLPAMVRLPRGTHNKFLDAQNSLPIMSIMYFRFTNNVFPTSGHKGSWKEDYPKQHSESLQSWPYWVLGVTATRFQASLRVESSNHLDLKAVVFWRESLREICGSRQNGRERVVSSEVSRMPEAEYLQQRRRKKLLFCTDILQRETARAIWESRMVPEGY